MMKCKERTGRLNYLDALKGILIILVVLGHAIQDCYVDDYQSQFLFRFIYSFHMPLFLLISGYLTYKNKYDIELIHKRAIQLLVPFISWALLSPFLKYGEFSLSHFFKAILYPDNGLWYLYNLFIYSCLFNISERWSTDKVKQEHLFILFYTILCVSMLFVGTLFNVTQLCWYMPFFAIGYYMHKYSTILESYETLIMVIGGTIFLLGMPFWMMREEPLFYRWIDMGKVCSYFYRILVMISGSVFWYILGKRYLSYPIAWLNRLGTLTLGIYAIHFIILYHLGNIIHFQNHFFEIGIECFLGLLLSLYLVKEIYKVKYLRLFLLGER